MLRKKRKLKQKRETVGSGFIKNTSSLTLGSDKTEILCNTTVEKGVFFCFSVNEPLRLLFNYPNTLVNADKKNQWQIQSPWNTF